MPHGKRTKTPKQDILKEIWDQISLPFDEKWKSKGITITGDSLESILEKIAERTGMPHNHLSDYEKTIWRLMHKILNSLIFSLEIINKPTIPYRLEAELNNSDTTRQRLLESSLYEVLNAAAQVELEEAG